MDIHTLKDSLCKANLCESGAFLLEEHDGAATLKKVTVCDIPVGSLVIKMDNKVKFEKFLKDQWGFNKHCDYLIVTEDKMVFIELKSKTDVCEKLIDDCQSKFKSDNCMLTYADKIFNEILAKNTFFDKREPHYVLLYQASSMAKSPTIFTSLTPNKTPDTFRKISVANEGTISFFRTI